MENAVEDRYKNGVEHVLLLLKLNTPYESLLLVDISIWPKHFSKFLAFQMLWCGRLQWPSNVYS